MSETAGDVFVSWQGARQYEVSRAGAPSITLDGHRTAGPGPVEGLLGALASCSAMDVVEYLEKRRTPATRIDVRVEAVRASTTPRRVLTALLEWSIDGDGIDRDHAERSVALAITTYCSVAATLAPDLGISTRVVLNGVAGPMVLHGARRGE